jgi:predicted component of type VI protein secretion system
MAMSSQKFIARNRAPRVQIEYDVEVYGSREKGAVAVRDGRDGRSVR